MVDGEVLERLWSYLSQFRKMTKEMSASHREDILSDYHLKENQAIDFTKSDFLIQRHLVIKAGEYPTSTAKQLLGSTSNLQPGALFFYSVSVI